MRHSASTDAAGSTIPYKILGFVLFSTLFLTRFGLSASGSTTELSVVLVVLLLSVMMLAISGLISVSIPRAALYSAAMAAMLISTMLGSSGKTSPTSIANLCCLYFCYIFVVADDRIFDRMIKLFRTFILIIALCGIVQFFAQFAIPGRTLFTFVGTLPAQMLTHQFNFVIPVPGLGHLNKSNGFFLVEPSSLSQMMTLGVIVELEFFKLSKPRLAALIAALLLSFSGTGLLLFALIVPAMLIAKKRGGVVLIGVPLMVGLAVAASMLHLTTMFNRLSEFGSQQSSGFARFESPFYLYHDYVFVDLPKSLFGLGPGSIDWYFKHTPYLIHDPTFGKLLFEYGVGGAIPFLIFILYCFFAGARSVWLSTALFIDYFFLGGNLLDARLSALILSLVILQNRPGVLRRPARPPGLSQALPSGFSRLDMVPMLLMDLPPRASDGHLAASGAGGSTRSLAL